jgi:hypothetical protein
MPPKDQSASIKPVPVVARQLLQDGETILMVVRKSAVVLVGLYLEILIAVGAFVAVFLIGTNRAPSDLVAARTVSSLAILVLVVALVVFILILVTFIYLENELIITDKGIIQVTQRGPFSNKAARLSIATVEDVSANQSGLLATVFNYGTLLIQTAGELDNFKYTYCPNPNRYAHEILEARQAYAESLREEGSRG